MSKTTNDERIEEIMEKVAEWKDGRLALSVYIRDTLHQELQKVRHDWLREEQGKRFVTLMNQALGETELPEDVWKKIAKVNQLILDK